MAEGDEQSDWATAARVGAWLVLPQLAIRKARAYDDRIVQARIAWLSFVVTHVVLGLILGVLVAGVSGEGDLATGLALGSVVLVGGGAIAVRYRQAARPLDVTDVGTISDSWYIRFLRQCAVISVILPWAAVAAVYASDPLVYVLGLALAGVGLGLLVPSDANLDSDADHAREQAADVDLLAVLRSGGREGGPPRAAPGTGGGGGDGASGRPAPTKRTGGGQGGRPGKKKRG